MWGREAGGIVRAAAAAAMGAKRASPVTILVNWETFPPQLLRLRVVERKGVLQGRGMSCAAEFPELARRSFTESKHASLYPGLHALTVVRVHRLLPTVTVKGIAKSP